MKGTPEGKKALEALKAALKDRDASVRIYAAQAVYEVDKQLKPAVQVLLECLKDTEEGVRAAAAFVLGEIGPPAATSSASPSGACSVYRC